MRREISFTRCAFSMTSAARKETEQALARRSEEQAALFRFSERLQYATSLPDVYDAGLDAILAALACERASILLFDDSDVMRFVGWRGLSDGYRNAVEGHSPWDRDEKNPRPVYFEDIGLSELFRLRSRKRLHENILPPSLSFRS